MKFFTIIITLITFFKFTQGQDIKVLESTIGVELNFTPEFIAKFNSNEALKNCEIVWSKVDAEGRNYKTLTKEEKDIIKYCSEIREDVWDIIDGGCSWYCGGGQDTLSASSELKQSKGSSYFAENIHDLNYKTAWIEGVPGYGIGEYITYHFPPQNPRITELIIVNGYVKSDSTWKKNSRVKTLKMYIDNKPHAILKLKNIKKEQHFTFEPLGYSERQDWDKLRTMPWWTIKFEILDVYKGDKYDDTAITEIYFDGIDVH